MRKTKLLLILAGFAAVATSCENGFEGDGTPVAPYTLSVDKVSIEADGYDAATLTIKDANGIVLTDEQYIKDCSFHILESDTYITRKTNTFTAIDNGTYTIEGMYLGKSCENTVSVKAANRSKYEVFSKKVAIYRLTSVECPNCPSMTAALATVDDFTKDHSIIMAFHGIVSSYDPFCLYDGQYIIASLLCTQFGLPGYPSAIYSLSTGSEKRTRSDLMGFVMSELVKYPATSGIKATSTVKDGKVTVNASVKVSADGKYDLGCAILQNGLDGGSGAYESVYNNVVRNISTNYRYMSQNAFTLTSGGEKTGLVYEDIPFDSEHQADCNIVLFTLVPMEGSGARIDNVISFPVGGSVDYIYNE
ncbi:MAG: Omp28-related outer membrane protein [Candidatus Cryptobacteroides sp.]